MKSGVAGLVALSVGLSVASSSDAAIPTISDGSFSSWTSTVVDPSPSSHTEQVLSSGGNPGATLYSLIVGTSDNLAVAHIKGDYTNTAALSGTWQLKFDYLKAPTATSGFLGVGLEIQQGTKYWNSSLTALTGTTTWQTATLTGTFTPSSFSAEPGTTGLPSFAAGVQTKFGLRTWLNGSAVAYGDYFDNWALANATLSVPEPTSLTALAMAALGLARRRK